MTDKKTVIRNINDAYVFISDCDPYKIRRGVLSIPGCVDMDVWTVGLRGTDGSMDKTSPLSLPTCFKSATARENVFFTLVKSAMLREIPAGANVVFIGHSLGGMVSQQLGADEELKSTYRLLNVLTFGSPYVPFRGNRCNLHRMIERADLIPMTCSAALFANPFLGRVSFESAGYYFRPLGAHCDSYEKSPVWRDYDCFGIKNGGRYLTLE